MHKPKLRIVSQNIYHWFIVTPNPIPQKSLSVKNLNLNLNKEFFLYMYLLAFDFWDNYVT